jgi:hypothetical protein
VLAHISSDLQSQEFIKSLAENARKSAKLTDDEAKGADLRAEIKKLDSKINRLSDLLSETTAIGTLLQKIEEFANQRASLEDQLSKLEVTRKQSKALREIKESDVQSMLSMVAENLPQLDRNSTENR